MDFLKVSGTQIVDQAGAEVRLRGFSFAGWLNFENFIIGIPGHESGLRRAVAQALGEEKAQYFFDRFLSSFIAEEDFSFIRDLGCNLVRLPFNYRHFESDEQPFVYLEAGFAWLDKAIAWARKYGIYLILDMHAAQGCQDRGFYTDNISGIGFLWEQRMYQQRAIALWREIARRYRDEPVIAGYDVLNEPIPRHISELNRFYHEAAKAIREVDGRHILFLEGDSYSTQFEGLDHPFDSNVVYSNHFYSCCGMDVMEYPGVCPGNGRYYDREVLRQEYVQRTEFMRRHGVPNWFGETSATFPAGVTEASRLRFLEDTLSIAEEMGDSWTFGIYKDLGKTGIVCIDPESPWRRRIQPAHDVIATLHCNAFADNTDQNRIEELCEALGQYAKGVIGDLDENLTARDLAGMIKFHVCECILPRQLQLPFARQFVGMSYEDIDRMMESFLLENCRRRVGWMNVVRKFATQSKEGQP